VDAARLRAAAPIVGLFIALALLVGVPAEAQPPAKLVRIGFLSQASLTSPTYHAFLQGLRDLGWVEGKHFSIDHAVSDGQVERLPALAIDLVRQHVDVIVATALAVEACEGGDANDPDRLRDGRRSRRCWARSESRPARREHDRVHHPLL
jgi:hypothetical protein